MANQPDTSTLEPEEPQTVVEDLAPAEPAAPVETPQAEAGEAEPPKPPKFYTDDKRADIYDKIEAKRAAKTKEFEGDTQDPDLVYGSQTGTDEEGDPTVEALERDAAAKARQHAAQELQQAAGQQQPADQGQMVRVKVDGVERDVPLAEMIANYQMNSAADERLARAKEIIEQAKALQAANQAPQPGYQPGTDAYQSAGQEQEQAAGKSQQDQQDLYDRVAEAMQLGDTQEAGQALRELVSSIATPQSSPQELAHQVAFQVRMDEENRRTETALRSFVQEHEQVGRDPRLQALGIEAMDQQFIQDFRASGVTDKDIYDRTNGLNPLMIRQLHRAGRAMGVPTFRSVAEILPVAYENTKAWLTQTSGAMQTTTQQQAPQTSERQQRVQRVAPQPAHRAGPPARPTPPKDTTAQAVAEMRAARFGTR